MSIFPLLLLLTPVQAACECGYLLNSTLFTHRIYNSFTTATSLPDWSIQTWTIPGNVSQHTLARQNSASNIWLSPSGLQLRQKGYTGTGPVGVAELHSIRDDIFHGSFRARFAVHGGPGAVAGFFFYYSDVAETDIEIITKDRGVVRYTNHPAYDAATDTLIAGATFKESLTLPWSQLQEHKFEWIEGETRFYQDNVLKRTIRKNVPEHPGKIMINLWANNGSWSGPPSTQDVVMEIQYVNLYFNTTESEVGRDKVFRRACEKARERGEEAVCEVDDEDGDVAEEAKESTGLSERVKWWMVAGLLVGWFL